MNEFLQEVKRRWEGYLEELERKMADLCAGAEPEARVERQRRLKLFLERERRLELFLEREAGDGG